MTVLLWVLIVGTLTGFTMETISPNEPDRTMYTVEFTLTCTKITLKEAADIETALLEFFPEGTVTVKLTPTPAQSGRLYIPADSLWLQWQRQIDTTSFFYNIR